MRKFKLIKEYPGCPEIGTIRTAINLEDYFLKFPEFWQEVKEPLFMSEDGVDIYFGGTYFTVETEHRYGIMQITNVTSLRDMCPTNKRFSTLEAAEKWVYENKPVFSRKEALRISWKWSGLDKSDHEKAFGL